MDIDYRIAELKTLVAISSALNEALDLTTALQVALAELVRLMGLTTGWIFMQDQSTPDDRTRLIHAVSFQLPKALAADSAALLGPGGCSCQTLYEKDKLKKSINIVECSRIEEALAQGGDVGDVRVHASVPIRARDRIIGILNVAGPAGHRFSDEDLQRMTAVGNQIGVAAERAMLFDMTRAQRVSEQAALLKLSNTLLSQSDLQAVVDQVVQVVADALGADACALILAEPDGSVEFRASIGWDLAALGGQRPQLGTKGPAGLAYYTGQGVRVDDFESDPRFEFADVHRMLGFRSAMVVPVSHSGHTIGALIVNTHALRRFNDDEERLMQLMANQAAIAIQQARLQESALAEQRLRKELELARQIQTSFLPSRVPSLPGWDFGAHYESAREVGGDFYDFIPLLDPAQRPSNLPGQYLEGCNLLGLVIADVSDKGVPAALFMALCRTLVRAVTISGRSPADAMQRVNQLIFNDSRTEQFVTLFYGVLNTDAATLRFANAGHNPPIMVRGASGEVFSLRAPGVALGMFDPIELTESEVHLEPGDVVFMYTDGVTDALNEFVEEFGVERLTRVLVAQRGKPAHEIVHAVVQTLTAFVGSREAFDDMTMVAVQRVD